MTNINTIIAGLETEIVRLCEAEHVHDNAMDALQTQCDIYREALEKINAFALGYYGDNSTCYVLSKAALERGGSK